MAGLSRRLSATLAVDLAYANCAPILRGVLNVFIPKHKLKQNQTTRTLQATFFASWRITSTFPFCILESLCLLWWLLNNRSLQAGSIIYGPGAICLFNWAGFLQQKARKKTTNQPTKNWQYRDAEGKMEVRNTLPHLLQGPYLLLCKQYGIWF